MAGGRPKDSCMAGKARPRQFIVRSCLLHIAFSGMRYLGGISGELVWYIHRLFGGVRLPMKAASGETAHTDAASRIVASRKDMIRTAWPLRIRVPEHFKFWRWTRARTLRKKVGEWWWEESRLLLVCDLPDEFIDWGTYSSNEPCHSVTRMARIVLEYVDYLEIPARENEYKNDVQQAQKKPKKLKRTWIVYLYSEYYNRSL